MTATVTLPRGRVVSYAEYGSATDPVVVFVPGFGHSRLAHSPGAGAGVRVIALDLPGVGGSSPLPGYDLVSWARQTSLIMDHLGIDRFAAVGWSWGGPYALALGQVCPERVSSVRLASALTGWLVGPGRTREVKPEFRTFGWWCRYTPFAARAFLRRQAGAFLSAPEKVMAKDRQAAPEADRRLMDDPVFHQMLKDSQREAWAQGAQGMYDHSRAVALPWGFDPAGVTVPIHLWQGGRDPEIRPAMARDFVQRSGAVLHPAPDDGHLLVFSHWDEIMQDGQEPA